MLKQGLHQKLLQKLSPQQIQLMKLLQIPAVNLEERIKEELEANPALEEGDETDDITMQEETPLENDINTEEQNSEKEEAEEYKEESEIDDDTVEEISDTAAEDDTDYADYLDEEEVADYKLRGDNYSSDEERQGVPVAVQRSFHEYLEQQIGMMNLSEEELVLADYLIGSMDDDGYLRRPLDAMVDDLSFSQNIKCTEEQLASILKKIQHLDPPGVGARDLKECLMLQLLRKEEEHQTEVDRLAIRVIEHYFDEFVKKHYDKLQQHLNIEDELLKKVIDEILKLNPKPGSAYSGSRNPEAFIIPDFFIQNVDGKLELSLHGMNIPELRVSNQFKEMLRDYNKSKTKDKQQKEAVMFIKQKIDSAKWFIDAIQQRYNTLSGVMSAIMNYQYEYFLTGDETKLKPMILKDIADTVKMDISTISRVANSKYVQTEFGTLKLKSLFSESLSTDSGEEVSTREVKKILSDLIALEDKRKPLADEKLTDLLREKGYNIARRTVAKYREQLNIPVARLRREL